MYIYIYIYSHVFLAQMPYGYICDYMDTCIYITLDGYVNGRMHIHICVVYIYIYIYMCIYNILWIS